MQRLVMVEAQTERFPENFPEEMYLCQMNRPNKIYCFSVLFNDRSSTVSQHSTVR